MSKIKMTLARKFAVAATAVTAVALPFQAGAAHASTPDDDLSACLTTAMSNQAADLAAGVDDDFNSAVDACVNAYLQEMGIDATVGGDSVNTGIMGTVDDGGVNTAVLGTVTDDSAST